MSGYLSGTRTVVKVLSNAKDCVGLTQRNKGIASLFLDLDHQGLLGAPTVDLRGGPASSATFQHRQGAILHSLHAMSVS